MSTRPPLTLSKKALDAYSQALAQFAERGVKHEGAVSTPFQILLDDCIRSRGWKVIPQYPILRRGRQPLRADGAVQLTDTLRAFLDYEEPALEEWEKASAEFKERIAEHGRALKEIIASTLAVTVFEPL